MRSDDGVSNGFNIRSKVSNTINNGLVFELQDGTDLMELSPAGVLDVIGGITFDGGANILSDYETGTWTPAFSSVAAPTYTLQDGNYIRIGDFVFFDFDITYSGLDTADGSGLGISGIPFDLAKADHIGGNLNMRDSSGINYSSGDTSFFGSIGSTTCLLYTSPSPRD